MNDLAIRDLIKVFGPDALLKECLGAKVVLHIVNREVLLVEPRLGQDGASVHLIISLGAAQPSPEETIASLNKELTDVPEPR